MLPTIVNYGNYGSDNYGAHTLAVTVGELTVWFSYQTVVAFQLRGKPKAVRRNEWGPTTGKHLNWIDGGGDAANKRLHPEQFERAFAEALGHIATECAL